MEQLAASANVQLKEEIIKAKRICLSRDSNTSVIEQLIYDAEKYTEDQIFEAALENGAEDVSAEDGIIEVTTSQADFAQVLEAMQSAGFEQESADVTRVADQMVQLDSEKAAKVMNIVNRLEDLDDVQQVSTNLELPEDYQEE